MANLIITVIAIALVAIASLMGAYYGGSAFLNNQAAANASTVLNLGQQLAGAWNAYLADNLNAAPGTATILVTNGYLAQIPNVPATAGVPTQLVTINGANAPRYYAYANVGAATTAAGLNDNAGSACARIMKTATGVTIAPGGTIPTKAAQTISAVGNTGNGTFGCAYVASGVTFTALGGATGGSVPITTGGNGNYIMEYVLQ